MTDKLLPCPFCGGRAAIKEQKDLFQAICCDCYVEQYPVQDKNFAVYNWNHRPEEIRKERTINYLKDRIEILEQRTPENAKELGNVLNEMIKKLNDIGKTNGVF